MVTLFVLAVIGFFMLAGIVRAIGWLFAVSMRLFFPILGIVIMVGLCVALIQYLWIFLLVIAGIIISVLVSDNRHNR